MMKNSSIEDIKMSMKVLIAEDNQYTALQYDKILQKYGHEVTVAKDGQECLEKFNDKSNQKEFLAIEKNPFDVVVLDQSMPKKTGSQVAEKILEQKPGQRIIFASAYGMTAEKNSESFKDRIEFLQKPFSLGKFVKIVTNQ